MVYPTLYSDPAAPYTGPEQKLVFFLRGALGAKYGSREPRMNANERECLENLKKVNEFARYCQTAGYAELLHLPDKPAGVAGWCLALSSTVIVARHREPVLPLLGRRLRTTITAHD